MGKAQACPPSSNGTRDRWWARRLRAFAHPTLLDKISPPRLDDDLGVRFRIGEIGKRLRDAVDTDAGGHHRGRIDLPFRDQAQRIANSSGV